MRAVLFNSVGPPSVLHVVTNFPKPVVKPGQVMIKVIATSVNPLDWKTRKGDLASGITTFPKIPNGDVAGVVVEAGPTSRFKIGDQVFGCSEGNLFWNTYGASAEYHAVGESKLAIIPPGWTFCEAAAVPLAGETAWQALQPCFPLAGKTVLVHAGAGGVGSFAIQIAKAQGATVATTCSGVNEDIVRKLGADYVFDYTKETFERAAAREKLKFDLVVDVIGGDYEARSKTVLSRKGRYSNVINAGFMRQYSNPTVGAAVQFASMFQGLAASAIGCGPAYSVIVLNSEAKSGLVQLSDLMAAGKLTPLIDRIMPLEESAAAHEYMEKGHARGKVVLQVAPEEPRV
ncbi:MAG: hypothetical protein WDW36_000686 [Sanguina aurantia]